MVKSKNIPEGGMRNERGGEGEEKVDDDFGQLQELGQFTSILNLLPFPSN